MKIQKVKIITKHKFKKHATSMVHLGFCRARQSSSSSSFSGHKVRQTSDVFHLPGSIYLVATLKHSGNYVYHLL
jgi:hypothetical protein